MTPRVRHRLARHRAWVAGVFGACGLAAVVMLTTSPPANAPASAPPPSASTTPAAVASSGSGVPAGVDLSPSGSITVTRPGTVIDAVHVTGYVHVKADDVTITRSRISYGGAHSVRIFDGAHGTVIMDSTVECGTPRTNAVVFGNYRAERVAVSGCRNDFMSSDTSPATVVGSTVDGEPFSAPTVVRAAAPVPGTATASPEPVPAAPSPSPEPAAPVPSPSPSPAATPEGGAEAATAAPSVLTKASVIESAGPRVAPTETLSSEEARERLQDTGLLERVEVDGGLDLSGVARSYTVRDVTVDAAGSRYGIRTTIGSGAVTPTGTQVLEHVEVFGASSAGLYLRDVTVRHADVWGNIDNIKSDDRVEVYASWLHDLAYVDGAHSDAIQIRAGIDQYFHGNVIDARHGGSEVAGPRAGGEANAGLQTGSMTGDASARFHGNWWSGGYYSARISDQSAPVVDYQFRDNSFARDYRYGAVLGSEDEPSGFGGVRFDSSNVWEDNGAPAGGAGS